MKVAVFGLRPFVFLALLFTIVPLVEVATIIAVGRRIGTLPTIGLMLATGLAGAWLARLEGAGAIRAIQRDLSMARLPTDSVLDAALVLVGGVCLVSPGFLTDAIGLALMVPPVRRWLKALIKAWIAAAFL